MTKMSTAQEISALLDDNGQRFERDDGTNIDALCDQRNGTWSYRDGYGTDTYRIDFGDGSAIVVAGAGWDLAPKGCEQFCWAGEGCQCKHCVKCNALLTDSQLTGPERCIDCADTRPVGSTA